MEDSIRENEEARTFHNLICEILKNKDPIFEDLVKLALERDVFFIPQQCPPGVRHWSVIGSFVSNDVGKLEMMVTHKIVLVPLGSIQEKESCRKELLCHAFELAHELGHIASFETDDLTDLLNCSFMRLSTRRVCPHLELRAFEEGIKIFEDILEKYDKEIKTKQKVKKFFFKNFYAVPEYRLTFAANCVIVLAVDKLALKEESDFCPVLEKLKDLLTRLRTCDSVS